MTTLDNEFLLQDRLQKIQQIVNQYGEDNFCISFSGGKDSTVLSFLVDLAIPGNNIPRVYADTGIELNMIKDFVVSMSKEDPRIQIIKPTLAITETLQTYGYPFKSKQHSLYVKDYQENGFKHRIVRAYTEQELTTKGKPLGRPCPKILRYQFTPENKLKISDECCIKLKEEPVSKWQKEYNKPYTMIGLMREEGGRRSRANCLAFDGKKLKAFQPLVPMSKEWEEWLIQKYDIKICDIYKPPYNFERTGCKGCPFNIHIQRELNTLKKFLPKEYKQCELIWKPVYDEYRRIGYRLKGDDIK